MKIILLFGHTASGKSKLELDIAEEFNGEIINADSMQVYKEIKILSARPDKSKIKHHFYGFISAKEKFSVGKWYELIAKKIKEIKKRKKIPILVGGTGLYFKSLIDGLVKIPNIPKNFRNVININSSTWDSLSRIIVDFPLVPLSERYFGQYTKNKTRGNMTKIYGGASPRFYFYLAIK